MLKKILILGGTQFVGRALVEQMQLNPNFDITLFNRQKTNIELFPDLKKIKGDRETADIEQIYDQYWDIIIDISCYFPNTLNNMLEHLEGKVGRYIFISTLSVYPMNEEDDTISLVETMPIKDCREQEKTDKSMTSYGERKAECERVLLSKTWLDKIILRPSIIYGQYDWTDRFYYWLYKAQMNMNIVLPDAGADLITLTYIGDLVDMVIASIGIPTHHDVYNATTHQAISIKDMIVSFNKNQVFVPMTKEELNAKDIQAGRDYPPWFGAPFIVSNQKLLNDFKIQCRDFSLSVEESKAYYQSLHWPKPRVGTDELREQKLLSN